MGKEPLEAYEPRGPGRQPGDGGGNRGRWKSHRKREARKVHFQQDLIPLIERHAEAREQSFAESVNQLLAEALGPDRQAAITGNKRPDGM